MLLQHYKCCQWKVYSLRPYIIRLPYQLNWLPIELNNQQLEFRDALMTVKFEKFVKAWFPYGRKNGVTIFLNDQLIVYTCKPHSAYFQF
jgi:hypothetical protein